MSAALHNAVLSRDPDQISAALYTDLIALIPASADPAAYDPRELGVSGGSVFQTVAWRGKLWARDDTSTAAADGLTCIILADGGHYLTNDVSFPGVVESRVLGTPPDSAGTSPSVIGKAWRLPTGATGTWAGHDNQTALGTSRGWQFRSPQVGDLHYVRAEKIYEHYSDTSAWIAGVPASIGAGTVPPDADIWDGRVENLTTNTPPSRWSKGVAYIVGSSASGAWAGSAGKVAVALANGVLANGDTFLMLTPYTGMQVFNKALGIWVQWDGLSSSWRSATGSVVAFNGPSYSNAALSYINNSSGYTFIPGTPPTTSNDHLLEAVQIVHAARKSGAKLIIEYDARLNNDVVDLSTVALYKDTDSTAIGWKKASGRQYQLTRFIVDAPDTSTHTYKIRLHREAGGSAPISPQDRTLTLMELG